MVVLPPGSKMHWHSNGSREEFLVGLGGQVVVEIQSAAGIAKRALRQGYSLFLPDHTTHRVVNLGKRSGRYLYVTGAH